MDSFKVPTSDGNNLLERILRLKILETTLKEKINISENLKNDVNDLLRYKKQYFEITRDYENAKVRVNNLKQKLRLAKSQLKTGNYLIRNLLLYNLLLLLLFLRSTCFTLIVNFLHQEELNRKKECDIKLKETCMPYRSSLSRKEDLEDLTVKGQFTLQVESLLYIRRSHLIQQLIVLYCFKKISEGKYSISDLAFPTFQHLNEFKNNSNTAAVSCLCHFTWMISKYMGYSLSAAVQLQGSTTRIYPTSVPYGAGYPLYVSGEESSRVQHALLLFNKNIQQALQQLQKFSETTESEHAVIRDALRELHKKLNNFLRTF
ncbi:uncharacterized protein LOC135119523 [Zophobas morio]|uniref:uncharacterized protein LOC135119523 n=1 Tax=Zophobas morio TaxID=2755281 RepID=UPI003083392E